MLVQKNNEELSLSNSIRDINTLRRKFVSADLSNIETKLEIFDAICQISLDLQLLQLYKENN